MAPSTSAKYSTRRSPSLERALRMQKHYDALGVPLPLDAFARINDAGVIVR